MSAEEKKATQDTIPLDSLDPIPPEENPLPPRSNSEPSRFEYNDITSDTEEPFRDSNWEEPMEEDLAEEPEEDQDDAPTPFLTSKTKKILVVILLLVVLLGIIAGIVFNLYSRHKFHLPSTDRTRVTTESTTEEETTAALCPHGHPYENGAVCGCPICIQEYGKDSNCILVAEYKKISIICPLCHQTQNFNTLFVDHETCSRCGAVVQNKDTTEKKTVNCKSCNAEITLYPTSSGLQNTFVKINEVDWASQSVYDVTGSAKTIQYNGTTFFYYPDRTVSLSAPCTCKNVLGGGKYHALYLYNGDTLTSVSGGTTPYYNASTGQFYVLNGKQEAVLDASGNEVKSFNHTNCAATASTTTTQ